MAQQRKLFVMVKWEKGWSWKKFAEKVDMDQSKVSNVYNGKWNLTDDEQSHWAKVLGCRVKDIF